MKPLRPTPLRLVPVAQGVAAVGAHGGHSGPSLSFARFLGSEATNATANTAHGFPLSPMANMAVVAVPAATSLTATSLIPLRPVLNTACTAGAEPSAKRLHLTEPMPESRTTPQAHRVPNAPGTLASAVKRGFRAQDSNGGRSGDHEHIVHSGEKGGDQGFHASSTLPLHSSSDGQPTATRGQTLDHEARSTRQHSGHGGFSETHELALSADFEAMFAKLQAFHAKHGHTDVPMCGPHVTLSIWTCSLRRLHAARASELPTGDLATADASAATTSTMGANTGQSSLAAATPPGSSIAPTDATFMVEPCAAPASAFSGSASTAHASFPSVPTVAQVGQLDALGFDWDLVQPESPSPSERGAENQWNRRLAELDAFRARYGHCSVNKRGEHSALGWFVVRTRQERRKLDDGEPSSLTATRIAELDARGFDWDGRDAQWERRRAELEAFQKRFGHCMVTLHQNEPAYRSLCNWIRRVRNVPPGANGALITPDRASQLTELGMAWHLTQSARQAGLLAELAMFVKEHGHCNVPHDVKHEHPALARWLASQKRRLKHWQKNVDLQHEDHVLAQELTTLGVRL